MGAQLRVFRGRIKSVKATKKITKAMELIASSRIVKAQQRVEAATPYTRALSAAVTAAASNGSTVHRLTTAPETRTRAAVCMITADRGLAGGYSSNIIREAEALTNLLKDENVAASHFLVGRKAVNFFRFRERPIAGQWTGFTDQPRYQDAVDIANGLLAALNTSSGDGGVDEIHLVYTHFENMAVQRPVVKRLIPLEVEDPTDGPDHQRQGDLLHELDGARDGFTEVGFGGELQLLQHFGGDFLGREVATVNRNRHRPRAVAAHGVGHKHVLARDVRAASAATFATAAATGERGDRQDRRESRDPKVLPHSFLLLHGPLGPPPAAPRPAGPAHQRPCSPSLRTSSDRRRPAGRLRPS